MISEIWKRIIGRGGSPVGKRGFTVIFALTILFAAISAVCLYRELDWGEEMNLTVEVHHGGQTERLVCWENEDGVCFVFLPGYADLSQVRLRTNTFRTVKLDGVYVPDGMSCEGIELGKEYGLVYNGEVYHPLIFLQSANCPTMFLDTESGSMDHIKAQKGNEETGVLRLYDETGSLICSSILDSVKGRGNASWLRSKKPYSLRLSQSTDLLGMGAAERWILLANANDGSNLRNRIAMDLARETGLEATPECRWVDLYLNGEYAGLYLLSERNEIHPQRVNISQRNGFLVSVEPEERLTEQNYPYVKTSMGTALRIHGGYLAHSELAEIFQSIENAILSETDTDPVSGKTLDQLIDLDSWARKYLLEELLANYDAGAVSHFFYGSDSGKVFAGPVWDYDGAFGFSAWQSANPYGILAGREIVRDGVYPWFFGLYQKEVFQNRVVELYRQEFRPVMERLLAEQVPQYAYDLLAAAEMNDRRNHVDDSQTSIRWLQSFMAERMAFLDSYWLEGEPFSLVYIYNGEGTWGCVAVRTGETLTSLPEPEAPGEGQFPAWYDADTGLPFDISQPIVEDRYVVLKWEAAVNTDGDAGRVP